MFQDILAGQGSSLVIAVGVVGLALFVLFLVFWLLRGRSSATFIRGGRNRQPRLAVLDAAAVDARRRLVLVRRDDVEHLILIGGPTDLVVESRILPAASTEDAVARPEVESRTAPAEASSVAPRTSRPREPEPALVAPIRDLNPVPVRQPANEPAPEPVREPVEEPEREPVREPERAPPRPVTERPVLLASRADPAGVLPRPAVRQPSAPPGAATKGAPNPVSPAAVATPTGPSSTSGLPSVAPLRPAVAARPQSVHSFATSAPFASRATATLAASTAAAATEQPRGALLPVQEVQASPNEKGDGDVREFALEALDAARDRVLPQQNQQPARPAVAPQPAPEQATANSPAAQAQDMPADAKPAASPTPPEPYDPSIDYNMMESDDQDFESILEAELSSDLFDLDIGPREATPLPQPGSEPAKAAAVEDRKSRDALEEEMERLLGDLSVRP